MGSAESRAFRAARAGDRYGKSMMRVRGGRVLMVRLMGDDGFALRVARFWWFGRFAIVFMGCLFSFSRVHHVVKDIA